MIRVIHTADLHLDAPFSGLTAGNKAAVRQEEMRISFSKIVSIAKQADALLISGDLFDGERVSRATLEFLKKQFARIENTPVFICAGNHDPFTERSVYQNVSFGENVHIFGTEPECVETEKADFYGVSFSDKADNRVLLPKFTLRNPEKINILVMHGNVSSEEFHPIHPAEIAGSGMDYIALGHIHKGSGLCRNGSTYYAYPGCHEGRGFDETGEKGVLALEIAKGHTQASFVPVQERMYIEEYIDVSGAEDYEDILDRIGKVYLGPEHIYRWILTGNASFPILPEVVTEKTEGYSVEVRDETSPAVDIETLKDAYSLKGLFVKYALEERNETEPALFREAIRTGLRFIEKEEKNEN